MGLLVGFCDAMPEAIEMYFDVRSERLGRDLWESLDRAGIPSLGSSPTAVYRPHVSLAVWNEPIGAEPLEDIAKAVATGIGLRIELASLGFFMTEESPAFLGATPTTALLDLHRRAAQTAMRHVNGYWPHYRPDAWIPHCTLAMHVAERARVADVASNWNLPIQVSVTKIDLIDVHTGTTISSLTDV
jgi:2'-5' RNA ligase